MDVDYGEEYAAVRVKLVEHEGSRFYSFPMEILRYFPNIELLYFQYAWIMEIEEPFVNCKSLTARS